MNSWAGARSSRASSTIRMIREIMVSWGGRETSTVRAPVPLMVPAKASSPSPRRTGVDSPVMAA